LTAATLGGGDIIIIACHRSTGAGGELGGCRALKVAGRGWLNVGFRGQRQVDEAGSFMTSDSTRRASMAAG
jgi:hypothetical protein